MKFVNCPLIGKRALSEFTYGGVVKSEPDLESVTDREWAQFVFYRHSDPQIQLEWWYHRPTGMWFVFERDTLTDRIESVRMAQKGAVNEA